MRRFIGVLFAFIVAGRDIRDSRTVTVKGHDEHTFDIKKGSIFLFKYVNGEDDFSTLDSLKIEKLNEIENCQIRSQVGDKLHVYYIGQLEDESIFDMRRRQGRNDKVKASIFFRLTVMKENL